MSSTFKIYNSSAGSGKTYALAKSYIKLLINAKRPEHFKKILALTFTNKAVGEMKERIISMLKLFSSKKNTNNPHPMFFDICTELNISDDVLRKKSKTVLNEIIHNYGAFDISTIDGFKHRIIRTFAYDLKLPVNFEVELDEDYLLTKAIDALISKTGEDKTLTKTLIDFAIEKADDDKSWNIAYDFKKIGTLLLNENDKTHLTGFKEKTLNDFSNLKSRLAKKIEATQDHIIDAASLVLQLLEQAGLEFDDFNRKSLPNYFLNLKLGKFNVKFGAAWQNDLLEDSKLYPNRVTQHIASVIDELQPELKDAFVKTKTLVFNLKFNNAVYKHVTPLSVLNEIQKELDTLKLEENKLLISEFNSIISDEIKTQPTPFIYERLGEKYKHYFIDEFQDTSKMQWQNLIPLIDNALSSTDGDLMLVGDAKQAIYSWRGGDAQQFINLYEDIENPFQIQPEINNLTTNYRSTRTIVDFNNSFFGFISESFFNQNYYKTLYLGSKQQAHNLKDGYVNLSFLDFTTNEERFELYTKRTLDIISSCLENGYQPKDICVIVRKKKEGIAVSDYLTDNGMRVLSSETLLLINSPNVLLLNSILELLVNPTDQKLKLELLNSISKLYPIKDKHEFFAKYINLNVKHFFSELNEFGIELNYNQLVQMPIYEVVESLVRCFGFCKTSTDAYVQSYLDIVFDYENKYKSDILTFLEFFESKKDKLSIAVPGAIDAVSVMTIHKSKGLEFPIVIFPFADLNIYREVDPKVWFPLDIENYEGFNSTLVNYTNDLENYSTIGKDIHEKHKSSLELENINLLYVTLTRAIEQLYIISKKEIDKNGRINDKTYSGLFIKYLLSIKKWADDKNNYEIGVIPKNSNKDNRSEKENQFQFISNSKESHNLKVITRSGLLWNTDQERAIEHGNIIHLLMAMIKTKHDIDLAINSMVKSGQLKMSQINSFKNTIIEIIEHPKLAEYFETDYEILNEKSILTNTGDFLRPDRVAIKNNKATLIDYKTGKAYPKYHKQLNAYANALKNMGYQIEKKLLIYMNTQLIIEEVK